MTELKTAEQVREHLRDLIREAIPERDHGRRLGLLTMADHWADSLRRRSTAARA